MIQPNGNFQQGNRRFAYFNLFGIGSFPSGQAASHSSHITVGCPRRQGGRGILGNWGSPQTHIYCLSTSFRRDGQKQKEWQTIPINQILKPFSESTQPRGRFLQQADLNPKVDLSFARGSELSFLAKMSSPFRVARKGLVDYDVQGKSNLLKKKRTFTPTLLYAKL